MSDHTRFTPATHSAPDPTRQFLDVEHEAWELHVRGQTPLQISRALNKPTSWVILTIRRWLEFRDTNRQQFVWAHVEKLLDEVNLVRTAAWSGWELSQKDKVRTVTKIKTGSRVANSEEITETTESQSGNPAYLRVMLDCNKRESALRGIERPTAVQPEAEPFVDIDTLIEQAEAAVKLREEALP